MMRMAIHDRKTMNVTKRYCHLTGIPFRVTIDVIQQVFQAFESIGGVLVSSLQNGSNNSKSYKIHRTQF